MSCLYVFNPTFPPKTTTTCTNGLITAQWPEPHTTPHTNKPTHHTSKHTTMWHTSLFWALLCAWWHSCYQQSKWDSTIHHDSTSSILDGDRYCHSIQNRSSPFATEWSIQIDKNTSRTELCCQAVSDVLQKVQCCATCFKGLHQEEQGKAADYLVHCSSSMHYPHLITSDALVNHNMNIKEHYSVAIQSKCTQNLDR